MAATTIAEIDAEIAALRSAKSARLRGEVKMRVSYNGESIEKALPSLSEINVEIARLQLCRSKLTGQSSGLGPVGFSLGRYS